MAKFCSSCGKELEENSTTCNNCGKPVPQEQSATTATPNPSTVQVNQTIVTEKRKSNGMAVAGFVISLVSLICCGGSSFLGLVFSIIGLVNAKNCDGEGKGLAIAGIIISSIFIVIFIICMAMGVLASAVDSAMYY